MQCQGMPRLLEVHTMKLGQNRSKTFFKNFVQTCKKIFYLLLKNYWSKLNKNLKIKKKDGKKLHIQKNLQGVKLKINPFYDTIFFGVPCSIWAMDA